MKSADPFFIKYIEKLIEDTRNELIAVGATGMIPTVATAEPTAMPPLPESDKAATEEAGDKAEPQLELFPQGDRQTTVLPAIGTEKADEELSAIEEMHAEPIAEHAETAEAVSEAGPSVDADRGANEEMPVPEPALAPEAALPEPEPVVEPEAAPAEPVPEVEPAAEEPEEFQREAVAEAVEEMEELEPEAEVEQEEVAKEEPSAMEVSETMAFAPPMLEEEPAPSIERMEEEQANVNSFTPIEETGLLDEKVEEEKPAAEPEVAETPFFKPSPPMPAAEESGEESDTLTVPGEALGDNFDIDIEKTQAYDKETLSRALDREQPAEESIASLESEQEQPSLTADDDSAGESFIFGGDDDSEKTITMEQVQAETPLPDAGQSFLSQPFGLEEPQVDESVFEVPPKEEEPALAPEGLQVDESVFTPPPMEEESAHAPVEPQAEESVFDTVKPLEAEEEAVFDVGSAQEEQDEDDDSLITGEDVMKKMDNFFGFDG